MMTVYNQTHWICEQCDSTYFNCPVFCRGCGGYLISEVPTPPKWATEDDDGQD